MTALRRTWKAAVAVRDSQGQVGRNGGWKRSLERFGWSGSAGAADLHPLDAAESASGR